MSTHKKQYTQLMMHRPSLDDLPELATPEGYQIRHFRWGDETLWNELMDTVFERETGTSDFLMDMGKDSSFRENRVWVAQAADGSLAATASSFWRAIYGERTAYMHWVGTHPMHAGRKLGYAVSLAALYQARRDGRNSMVLHTDDSRLGAIKTYLRLGFVPFLTDEDHRERWRLVLCALKWPAEEFEGILIAPLQAFTKTPRDYITLEPERRRRMRWLPERIHAEGSGGGQADALAGEWLYRPAELGMAYLTPSAMDAGTCGNIQLYFENGREFPAGTRIRFCIRGQVPLGARPQTDNPERDNYASLKGPQNTRLTQWNVVEVTDRPLLAGSHLTIDITNLHASCNAISHRIYVEVQMSPNSPPMRLPEPIVFQIRPGRLAGLEVHVPPTMYADDKDCIIRAVDAYENRVPLNTHLRIRTETGDTRDSYMTEGLCRVPFPTPQPTAPARLYVSVPELDQEFVSNPSIAPIDGEHLYFGDLHCHDFLSEAYGRPDEVMRFGRDDKRLDFLSVVNQSHGYHDNEKWTIAKHTTESFLEEGRFVTFLGFEWQHSHYGDKVITYLGGDQPYLPVDDARYDSPAKLYEALRRSDALVISHHPARELDAHCPGTRYDSICTDVERCIEIWSMHGSSEGIDPKDRPVPHGEDPVPADRFVLSALQRLGLRLGMVGGSDSHVARPGGSNHDVMPYRGGFMGVWAKEKTRRSIFEAIRNRRTYALTQDRIILRFAVNGTPMGGECRLGEDRSISVYTQGQDAIQEVQILRNGEIIHKEAGHGTGMDFCFDDHTSHDAFYHCRVVQKNGELAVSSPVWVNRNT